jgi:CO dehydrogenase/acetyl-CoA synthase delta subunit
MMAESEPTNCECGTLGDTSCCGGTPTLQRAPVFEHPSDGASCCGASPGPPSSPYSKPGYTLCSFVESFMDTPVGPIPRIKTILERRDWRGTFRVRAGFARDAYRISPGLYAVGSPDGEAPVLVTANYKLSFDHLRRHMADIDAWILVLDTRGINVWCAAGKGTFGDDELIRQVKASQLDQVVSHRKLVLPQLGATGVSAQAVKKRCGFEALWGPVYAKDIRAFLEAGNKATEPMRRVTFSLVERMVLIPVEISLLRKYLLWTILTIFALSGIGWHLFSLSAAWNRGWLAVIACLAGIAAGCVAVPLLLPWLPGRAFALKGTISGLVFGFVTLALLWSSSHLTLWSGLALLLLVTALSSFLAMNFTGATPFTSPSGVEKEMRRAIPLQLATALLAIGLWVGSSFAS